ncbi:peptidase S8 [Ectobacillus sp. JY-23]|uniref:peptidase S8 n=1 Tax=Ectobacillus sp. JY-23 TaxID=2933872 RepID=UPI001FF572B3|nr:peptidase S8 [Ectobacillus sp. JY-23]UOY91150.1 peptidase S8 [Ectobacillus sp. JY-23]WBR81428.1 collagenase [Bacillus sp. (in: firmicutes)]
MMSKRMKKVYSLLICFTFILSILSPLRTAAAPMDKAVELKFGTPATGKLKAGEEAWFKISPGKNVSTASHVFFTVSGTSTPHFTVYADLQSAQNEFTYANYENRVDGLEYPLAWTGPYYIKVVAEAAGDYTINTEAVTKPPGEREEDGGMCMIEESVKGQKTSLQTLASMRTIRDSLLNQTKVGKEITSLYYKVSATTVFDVVKDKKYRDEILKYLEQLRPLLEELEKIAKGKNSDYTITDKDYQTIIGLKDLVLSKSTTSVTKEVNAQWTTVNAVGIKGKKLNVLVEQLQLKQKSKKYVNNEIIVSVNNTAAKDAMVKAAGALSGKQVKVEAMTAKGVAIANTYVLKYEGNQSPEELAALLQNHPAVTYAEPNHIVRSFANDIQYQYHWSLENNGQAGGEKGADIRYKDIISLLAGKKYNNTLIAVVDTGTNYTVQDLKSVVRTDLDKDFVNEDDDAIDDNDHGTHVAGTIAALGNNSYSMTGINPFANILPVKVLDADGGGTVEQIALGIRHAVDKGAKVINLSLGSSEFSETIEKQLIYAKQKGVTVVAAAGNDGEGQLSYPASSEYVISVGATDPADMRAEFSNFGKGLDIVAPGVGIPSLMHDGEVMYLSGTSMAAPHVAAIAGLIYSIKPNVKPNEVQQILTKNTVDLGALGYDEEYGSGRLDASRVLHALGFAYPKPAKPTVKPVDDNDTVITGTAKAQSIIVKNGKSIIGNAPVDAKGNYTIKIKAQKAGTVLHVSAISDKGVVGDPVAIPVKDATPPAKPTVETVSSKSTSVIGQTEAGAVVTVMSGTKTIGTGKANSKGRFSIAIAKQKTGTELTITATDGAKNVSGKSIVKVK